MSNDLIERFGEQVNVPDSVRDFAGESEVLGFNDGSKVTLQFPNIHAVDVGGALHEKFVNAVSDESLGNFTGDEFRVTLPIEAYSQKFKL